MVEISFHKKIVGISIKKNGFGLSLFKQNAYLSRFLVTILFEFVCIFCVESWGENAVKMNKCQLYVMSKRPQTLYRIHKMNSNEKKTITTMAKGNLLLGNSNQQNERGGRYAYVVVSHNSCLFCILCQGNVF